MLAVVADSSPLIYLTRLNLFAVLRKLHEQVLVPHAVWNEVAVLGKGYPEAANLESAVREKWIKVETCSGEPTSLGHNAERLQRGEIEAILLARERKGLLLTDDSDGREVAEACGLLVSGTIGILTRAKRENYLPQIKPLLEQLRKQTNFRMSETLYCLALSQAGETSP
jgi:predicted nucleic acid-binding protein